MLSCSQHSQIQPHPLQPTRHHQLTNGVTTQLVSLQCALIHHQKHPLPVSQGKPSSPSQSPPASLQHTTSPLQKAPMPQPTTTTKPALKRVHPSSTSPVTATKHPPHQPDTSPPPSPYTSLPPQLPKPRPLNTTKLALERAHPSLTSPPTTTKDMPQQPSKKPPPSPSSPFSSLSISSMSSSPPTSARLVSRD